MNQSAPQAIETANSKQGMYDHLGRSDSIGSAHSLGGMSFNSESNLSYSRLERFPSWGSQASYQAHHGEQYNRLNAVPSSESNTVIQEESYDRLARSPSTSSRLLSQSVVSTINYYYYCSLKIRSHLLNHQHSRNLYYLNREILNSKRV